MTSRSSIPVVAGIIALLVALTCGCGGALIGGWGFIVTAPGGFENAQEQFRQQADQFAARAQDTPSEEQAQQLKQQARILRWMADVDPSRIEGPLGSLRLYAGGLLGSNILKTLLLLVGGIGLILYKNWGRWLLNAASVLSLLAMAALAGAWLLVVSPALGDLIADAIEQLPAPKEGAPPRPSASEFTQGIGSTGACFTICPEALWPLLLLVLVNLRSVRVAVGAVEEETGTDDGDDWTDDEDDWEEPSWD